jgi:general stress protein YciG
MPGTLDGGKKSAMTNKRKYGEDFFIRLGAMGGRAGHTGGFFANRELAREAGRKGGKISRKQGPHKKNVIDEA